MPHLNKPEVVAEIAALHDAYERALVANDVEALNRFFWDSPDVVRYGVAEHLYGFEAIAAYRQGHTPAVSDRQLLKRSIVSFDEDVVSVMCEISQIVAGQARHSRQSQVWVRFSSVGWKIVSAHVSNALPSNPWDGYVEQTAARLGLPIAREYRTGVAQNLSRAAAIATPLLCFPLESETQPLAPVFTA